MKKANYLLLFVIYFNLFSGCSDSKIDPITSSNLYKAHSFGIYTLLHDSLVYKENRELDTSRIMIDEDPLISMDDIEYFDLTGKTFHLKKAVGWGDLDVPNAPFVIAADGELLHYGYFYFWPNCCWPMGPAALTCYNHPILKYTLQLHGLDIEKFVEAIPQEIKQRDMGFTILESELIMENDEPIRVELEVRITNNLAFPVYIFDLEKGPNHDRFYNIYREDVDWGYDYHLIDQLYTNPDIPSQWSLDWYTVIRPSEYIIRRVNLTPHYILDLNKGEDMNIVFTMDNLAGAVPEEFFKNSDPPIWIGKIVYRENITL